MYFPIVGYLTAIEESNDANSMDSNYNQLISKIQLLQYFSLGREYILNYAQSIIKKNWLYITIAEEMVYDIGTDKQHSHT